ncbi:MAG: 30S ribosomal protein S20 [Gammaproteobacteria bacterium]|nr:30S ribosomal protein S20 [Gammaproteobacteria bacterium]
MANNPQARKRSRQAESRRARNASQRSMYRTYLKRVNAALAAGDKEAAAAAFETAVPVLDKLVGRGILHRNKAARHKSRLHAQIQALG